MGYLALYRKYRPESFEDVVGQEHIVKILKNSIINNKVSHAYLFSGPRGTGKTTISKVIAKIINCSSAGVNPCDKCPSCLAFKNKNNPDIIEMDAASNNGVDEIREIRDKASLLPSLSKYKIYIIDEVHMLSSGAFNALLKTLEEPPVHVIFILATTEFYKVPETIVSRCQCFEFERLNPDFIASKLKAIASKEGLKADLEIFNLIANYSEGGLRDAINTLDKLSSCNDTLKVKDFYELRGLVKREDLDYIAKSIFEKDIKSVLTKIDDISKQGKNIILLTEELMIYLKDLLIKVNIDKDNNIDIDSEKLYKMITEVNNSLINMKKSSNPKLVLEICLIKLIDLLGNNNVKLPEIDTKKEKQIVKNEILKDIPKEKQDIEEQVINAEPKVEFVKEEKKEDLTRKEEDSSVNEAKIRLEEIISENHQKRIRNALALADKKILSDMKIRWIDLNDYLYNKEFSSIVSYLMDGNLRVAGEKDVIISVPYSSVALNARKSIDKVELLLNLICNKYYKIAFVLDEEWEEIKKQYINDKNNNIIYEYQEEQEIDYDIITKANDQKEDLSKVAVDAISLFGNDLVEIG